MTLNRTLLVGSVAALAAAWWWSRKDAAERAAFADSLLVDVSGFTHRPSREDERIVSGDLSSPWFNPALGPIDLGRIVFRNP
jgi:hypothetical protein